MTVIWRVPRPLLVHITTAPAWAQALASRWIEPASLDAEGFVHLSTTWQAPLSAARYYGGVPEVLALALDPGGLRLDLLRWEESHPGQFFPHHYGPIAAAAVVAALPFTPPAAVAVPATVAGPGDPPVAEVDPVPWPLPQGWPPPPVTSPLPEGWRVRVLADGAAPPADGDVAAVVALVDRAVAARDGTAHPGTSARAAERLATPGGWGVVVESANGALRSVVLGVPKRADDGVGPVVPGWCHLGTVMTDPEHWGRGLATRLLVESVSIMRARGYAHAELWTQVGNARAQAVYRRLDFVPSPRPELAFEGEVLAHHTLALRP